MALDADNKKKVMFLVGLAGVLGIAGLAILKPWAGSTTPAAPAALSANSAAPSGGAAPAAAAGGGMAGIPAPNNGDGGAVGAMTTPMGVAPSAANAPQLVSAEESRNDPFEQYYTRVLNLPTPPPPPPTPRPTPTPLPPIPLPSPEEATGSSSSVALPGTSSVEPSPVLVGLPSPRISRYLTAPTQPTIKIPPPSFSGGTPVLTRSPNKRLAGVVIGDSVRALLEIDDGSGGEPVSRVVQPGDEVEGVRILRIERYTEGGGRSRVRLIVRENGEERAVELRASANASGGAGGMGGAPGGMGGLPGGLNTGGRGGRGGFGTPPLP